MTRGAGGGRPAKPTGQARNKMPRTRDSIVVPADARVAKVPDAPLPLEDVALKVWEQMWSQPIATLWNAADLAALCRLVIMQTTVDSFVKPDVLREMRQLEDRFLLNPYSRAQQRVVIGSDGEEPSNGNVAWFEEAQRRLRGAG